MAWASFEKLPSECRRRTRYWVEHQPRVADLVVGGREVVVEVEGHPLGQRRGGAHHPVEPPQHVVAVAVVAAAAAGRRCAPLRRAARCRRAGVARASPRPPLGAPATGPPATGRSRRASTGGRSADRSVATPRPHLACPRRRLHGDSAERSRKHPARPSGYPGADVPDNDAPERRADPDGAHGWRAVRRRVRRPRRRLPLRAARLGRHRPLRRAHVLQGHRAPPDGARHLGRDRRHRRRVQRLHRQGADGLLREVRRRRPRRWRSTCCPTCCSPRGSTPTRSSARRA